MVNDKLHRVGGRLSHLLVQASTQQEEVENAYLQAPNDTGDCPRLAMLGNAC